MFVRDRLHLNEAGYDQWAALIRRRITETFKFKSEFEAKAGSAAAGESSPEMSFTPAQALFHEIYSGNRPIYGRNCRFQACDCLKSIRRLPMRSV